MIRTTLVSALILIAAGATLGSCGRTVERTGPDAVRDHSGNWNVTDTNQAAQNLSAKLLAGGWHSTFTEINKRPPTVRVGRFLIRTQDAEYIDVNNIKDALVKTLINSGKVYAVASKDQAPEIRDERSDGNAHSDPTTIKPDGKEIKGDFLLTGTINTQDDAFDGKKQKAYFVKAEIFDQTTNRIVFTEIHQITKDVSGSGVR